MLAPELMSVTHAVASEIAAVLAESGPGHCLRVDFLSREAAIETCAAVRAAIPAATADVYVLGTIAAEEHATISTDRAIELRNRKRKPLCLFIPSDLVDPAASSLSNSFAVLDARELHDLVLARFVKDLPQGLRDVCAQVLSQAAHLSMVGTDWRLEFVNQARALDKTGAPERLGRELWRVGLVADLAEDFADRLDRNRRAVQALTKPLRATSAPTERLLTLGLDASSVERLQQFFQWRDLQAVRVWSRDIANGAGPSFHEWTPSGDPSRELRSVFLRSFLDKDGNVESFTKLAQPDGAGGPLFASTAPKSVVVVRWDSEPANPRDVHKWRAELVPSSGTDLDSAIDLPSVEVAASRKTARIRIEVEGEAELDSGLRVRIVPLDLSGAEIFLSDASASVDQSEEFFLTGEAISPGSPSRETRRESASIALGRLEAASSSDATTLTESQPQWSSRDLEYFSLRLNERRLVSVATSKLLRDAQTAVLADARSGGRLLLETLEVAPAVFAQARSIPIPEYGTDVWLTFWRTRELFFTRIRKGAPRDTIETADWTGELAAVAIRYAQAYAELLSSATDPQECFDALSLDTILVALRQEEGIEAEETIVVLPTHPARVAWMAGYTQLLALWERQVLESTGRARRLDLVALRGLAPSNVPAFVVHPSSSRIFTFFENVRFSCAVALPPDAPDALRRFSDAGSILGVGPGLAVIGDVRPQRVARQLERYRAMHPTSTTLRTALVNPDQGELFAEAVSRFVAGIRSVDSEARLPRIEVTAFVRDVRKSTLAALRQIRELRAEDSLTEPSDPLHPGLAATVRSIEDLSSLDESHIAIVSDFTSPTIRPTDPDPGSGDQPPGLGLYGLIARLTSSTDRGPAGIRWTYRLATDRGSLLPHPAGPRYSDSMAAVHAALLSATANHLGAGPQSAKVPALEVTLSSSDESTLESLHRNVDWVLTLDRYFGVDYYDSPYAPHLAAPAQRYLIDYSPELAEGQGHRVMVTTAWRDEIQGVLHRALADLGFVQIEQSVGRLLHYLKTVSGRLALEAMGTTTSATAAASLGVVTAWLQRQGRLKEALLVPVDLHPRLFSSASDMSDAERRCDLALFMLRRGIVEAAFIEVKWRRGQMSLDNLASDIVIQTRASADAMRERFFNDERCDGALQRAYLSNVLSFYLERAKRYQLLDESVIPTLSEHIARLERTGLQFRPSYEGYVVSLGDEPRKPIVIDDARIVVLTARDFEESDEFSPGSAPAAPGGAVSDEPGPTVTSIDKPIVSPSDPIGGATDPAVDVPGAVVAPLSLVSDDTTTSSDSQTVDPGSPTARAPSVQEESDPRAHHEEELEIALGDAKGGAVLWKPSVRGSPHMFITGIPGQGKSWTLLRVVRELERAGVPALVIDFHGQFAAELADLGGAARIIDASQGLPFSPFECSAEPGPADWRGNAYALSEIFAYVVGLGDIQRDVVYTALRDAYRSSGFQEDGSAASEYPTLRDVRNRIEQTESVRRVSNVAARCRALLEMDLFKPSAQSVSMIGSIRDGLIVDLSKLYLDSVQIATCAFLLRKTYKEMLQWRPVEKLRLAIVIDEAHRLSRDLTVPKLMKEGRKFGIAVIAASQGIGDFHADVIGNAGTKVIFRTNYPESRRVSGFVRTPQGVNAVSVIEQLPVGTAYVQTPEMSFASVTRMAALR